MACIPQAPRLQRHLGPGKSGKPMASSFTLHQLQLEPSAFGSSMTNTSTINYGSCIESIHEGFSVPHLDFL